MRWEGTHCMTSPASTYSLICSTAALKPSSVKPEVKSPSSTAARPVPGLTVLWVALRRRSSRRSRRSTARG